MNILVLSPDIPYPPNKGQRADVWRKLLALQTLDNVQLALVYFYDDVNHQQHVEFKGLCVETGIQSYGISIKRSLLLDVFRIFRSFYSQVPYHALVRTPARRELSALSGWLANIKPDVTLLEGLWIYETFRWLVDNKCLTQDFYYRSHNIEHAYMTSQLSLGNARFGSIKKYLHTALIEKYEHQVLRSAKRVLDISFDDAVFWRSKGINHIEVLTSIPESALLDTDALAKLRQMPKIHDLLFLGNLKTPNNVQGVMFLVNQVLPLVIEQHPSVRLIIAGSSPVDTVITLCKTHPNVQLLSNVPDAFALMCQANILLNPVATGSGVMVKMLDLLMTNQPIITTSQGTHGLPEEIKHTVVIADTAVAFAKAIIDRLAHGQVDLALRAHVRRHFGIDKVKAVMCTISDDLANKCS